MVLLLGKALRLQGKTTQASLVLAVARDLDPRNAAKIAKLVEETGPMTSAAATTAHADVSVNLPETSVEESGIDVSMDSSME